MSDLIIAIDPGTETGYAEYDGTLMLKSCGFWCVIDTLVEVAPSKPTVIIESTSGKGNFRAATSKAVAFRMGTNVGVPMRDAILLQEYCESLELEVVLMPPVGRKYFYPDDDKKGSKISHAEFIEKAWPDYLGSKTNPHKRDAGILIRKYLDES